ncbi:MAG: DUF420 domain-containing protein [Spirochaetia bacterium]|nr:DUF420 domain-containing protein [Spirochaetia bacterium]
MRLKPFLVLNLALSVSALSFLIWIIYGRDHHAETSGQYAILPALNACLNGTSAVLLSLALWAVKTKRIALHRGLMSSAFIVSTLFLACYILYHTLHGDSKFLGQGWVRPIYFFILISHILLSAFALPLVLLTFFLSLTGRIPWHKKVAPYTWAIWMYVSVTGVAVYLFLRAYRP